MTEHAETRLFALEIKFVLKIESNVWECAWGIQRILYYKTNREALTVLCTQEVATNTIRIQGDSYRNRDDVAYVVILSFYSILACFAPSGGQKMFSKIILLATAGSVNVVLKISQTILINDLSFQCYFRRMD